MKPSCYNRPPFKDTVIVRDGWLYELVQNHEGEVAQISVPRVKEIPDPMSKTCQQHGPMGEVTLHPDKWDCAGCQWKPTEEEMYVTYNEETASTKDRIAWALCQIIDDDAPMRWTRYRFAASCIAMNPDLMADLLALQKEETK